MVFVTLIDRVFDHTQPARPWAELSEQGFAPPIRENWRFRIVVNLVWFARNYLNICVGMVLAVAYWFPGFLATVCITVFMHSSNGGERTSSTRRVLQLAQLGSLCLNNYLYGWLSGFLFSLSVAAVILLHAVFTPYTDERVKRYNEAIGGRGKARRGSGAQADGDGQADTAADPFDGFAPRTPVMSYTGTGAGNFPLTDAGDESTEPSSTQLGDRNGRRASKTFSDFKLPPQMQGQSAGVAAGLRRRSKAPPVPNGAARPALATSLPSHVAMGAWNSKQSTAILSDISATEAAAEPPAPQSPTAGGESLET